MRPYLCSLLLLSMACETVEEDFVGRLVAVQVSSIRDDCRPTRFTGDGGVQFIGRRSDGGVAFTMARQAVYGPLPDGGELDSVSRHGIPVQRGGYGNAGEGEAECQGIFNEWTLLDDDTLSLYQELPGATACENGPLWLPAAACATDRTFSLTQTGECRLSCVRLTASGSVTCDCS